MKRWLGLAIATAALSAALPAHAQPEAVKVVVQQRKVELATHKGWILMSVGFRDVVNAKVRQKLMSGLPTTIATRAYVFPDDTLRKPLALSAQTCKVVFDLWDEVFRIELIQGGKRKKTVAVNVEGVMRNCTEMRRLPLLSLDLLQPHGDYFVAVMVEVNPLSKEMLAKIKRWVSRPNGAGAVGPGDSLFGSFVGLFITKVPEADRSLTFRSQGFKPAALPKLPEEKKKKGEEQARR